MKLELDPLVSSLKQKLGHYHPCLLGSSVLRPGLRAWSWSGETAMPRRTLLRTRCTPCSWKTGTRGRAGQGGGAGKAVALALGWSPLAYLCSRNSLHLCEKISYVFRSCIFLLKVIPSSPHLEFLNQYSKDPNFPTCDNICVCFFFHNVRWWREIIEEENCQIHVYTM